MAVVITQSMIQAVRFEVADTDPSLPILADDEIRYLLNKHNGIVNKASLDAARIALMKLSQFSDEIVGIISVKGSKVAEQYRLALQLYLSNPLLNPVLNGLNGSSIYAGGISNSDMQINDANPDNNYIPRPVYKKSEYSQFSGAFSV